MSKQRVYCKMEEFQPRPDLILVKPIELKGEETTESGIVFSLNANNSVLDRPSMGEVIAIGSKIEDIELGKTIFWAAQEGIDLEFDDSEGLVLRMNSVTGTKKEK